MNDKHTIMFWQKFFLAMSNISAKQPLRDMPKNSPAIKHGKCLFFNG